MDVFGGIDPDEPITGEALRRDSRFAGATILSQPFVGNRFDLTDDQWTAIVDHRQTQRSD